MNAGAVLVSMMLAQVTEPTDVGEMEAVSMPIDPLSIVASITLAAAGVVILVMGVGVAYFLLRRLCDRLTNSMDVKFKAEYAQRARDFHSRNVRLPDGSYIFNDAANREQRIKRIRRWQDKRRENIRRWGAP